MAVWRKSGAEGVPAKGADDSSAGEGQDLKRRLLLVVVAAAALVAVYLIAAALVPRWWAQRIGDAVNGHLWVGVVLGVTIGVVCTLLPLFLLRFAVRRERSPKARGAAGIVALLLAAPNLCTLAVVIGRGGGARAGRTVMDVRAPMFRGATLTGAIVGAVLFVALVWLLRRRRGARAA